MFKKNQIVSLLAAAMLATACGGGSSSPSTGSAQVQTTTATNVGTAPAGNTVAAPADQQLAGYLALVASQMPYIRTSREYYNAVSLAQIESREGMLDFASGSKGGDENTGIPPSAIAPAAPIAAIGYRVEKMIRPATDGQNVSGQTVVGRAAFSLTERADSPGIGANEAPEIMRFVIDGVELKSDARGELIAASVKEGAQMHVYGRNAASGEIRASIPVPANAVRLMPVDPYVLDHYGDTTSVVLLFDLEAAFSQAGTRFASLENIAGHFTINMTMSVARLIRPAADANIWDAAVERRDLAGQAITVNDRPAVTGGGISGNAWVRSWP